MIQHMNLVFQADGLSVGEGAFLMACANHTDDRGYVIAHMQQIADEAHMSLRSAQDQKKRLIKRKLVAAKPRFSKKNNAQLADLIRINLTLLASMKRKQKDYGKSLIEELTFGTLPGENTSSDPGADLASPPAESAPPHADLASPPARSAPLGGARSAPLLLPSSSPSSLSPDPADPETSGDTSEAGEREEAAPKNNHLSQLLPASPSDNSETDKVIDSYIAAHVAAHRLPPRPTEVKAVRAGADSLLAAGHSVDHLCHLAADIAGKGWTDLVKHAKFNPAPAARAAVNRKPWCGECNDGREPQSAAERMRETETGMARCHCHPGYVAPQPACV